MYTVNYIENMCKQGPRIHQVPCGLGVVLIKLKYFFVIFQSSEVTHLISCQPTALKAVRLQSLVPPNPDKICIRDLLVKNEVRIHKSTKIFWIQQPTTFIIIDSIQPSHPTQNVYPDTTPPSPLNHKTTVFHILSVPYSIIKSPVIPYPVFIFTLILHPTKHTVCWTVIHSFLCWRASWCRIRTNIKYEWNNIIVYCGM